MVFSSAPLYLDPPNWQQQLHGNGSERNGINISNNNNNHHHLIPPPPPTIPQPPPHHHQVGRPTPTAERARLEKIPPPETPLKCPRCDSTNTKFCYYNNYNLNQPRHFCKTCRRYWTRGGALRNVPVGGGYRKNKRSSGGNKSSSTSTSTASASATAKSSSSLSLAGPAGGSFMASLQSIAQLGGGMGSHLAGLGFGGGGPLPLLHNNVNPLDQFDHYGISNTMLSQHHHQMAGGFPNFLGGFGGGSSTSSFQNVVVGGDDVGKVVKMENGLNIEKGILMGISTSPTAGNNNNQFWGNINNNNNNNIWSGTGNHEL